MDGGNFTNHTEKTTDSGKQYLLMSSYNSGYVWNSGIKLKTLSGTSVNYHARERETIFS